MLHFSTKGFNCSYSKKSYLLGPQSVCYFTLVPAWRYLPAIISMLICKTTLCKEFILIVFNIKGFTNGTMPSPTKNKRFVKT